MLALELSERDLREYRREGWAHLQNVVSVEELSTLREVAGSAASDVRPLVNIAGAPYRTDPEYQRMFRLTKNLHLSDKRLFDIAARLGLLASQLSGCERVRLIQDTLFVKPSAVQGGLPTPWHQDLPKFPFDRRGCLTVWLAIEDVPY